MDAICVAPGGLGSSFDQLALNREMLVTQGVKLRGVILNKVDPSKMEMISVSARCFERHGNVIKSTGVFLKSIEAMGRETLRLYPSTRCIESPVHSRF